MATDLSETEIAMLRELVADAHADLRGKDYETEDTDYKRQLKQREEALESMLRKLNRG